MRSPRPSEERRAAAWIGVSRSMEPSAGRSSSCRPANGTPASNSTPLAEITFIGPAWATA